MRHILLTSAIAVFVAARAYAEHWVSVGRSCQRFALQATAIGMKHASIT